MNTELCKKESRIVKAEIKLICEQELKDILGDAADEAELPLSEYVVRELARIVKRIDLAKVPRKKMGRPRKVAS